MICLYSMVYCTFSKLDKENISYCDVYYFLDKTSGATQCISEMEDCSYLDLIESFTLKSQNSLKMT